MKCWYCSNECMDIVLIDGREWYQCGECKATESTIVYKKKKRKEKKL